MYICHVCVLVVALFMLMSNVYDMYVNLCVSIYVCTFGEEEPRIKTVDMTVHKEGQLQFDTGKVSCLCENTVLTYRFVEGMGGECQ